MPDTYYKLARNNRWLNDTDSNPESIQGRSTDIGQIGLSLEAIIKNLYPINGVPETVALRLEELKRHLQQGEEAIDKFIEQVSQEMWYNQLHGKR